MNRHLIYRVLTAILLSTGIAHADVTYHNYNEMAAPGNPQPAPQPAPPYEGTGRISNVTRQRGGELYVLDLSRPLPLTQLKAKSKTGRVKIIGVNLITEKKERISVKAFSNITVADTEEALASEILTADVGISALEIQAEAMGGAAALEINALSNKEIPQLTLREDATCKIKLDPYLKEKLDIVQRWAARVESSAVGSIQEKYATKEFNKYVAEFIAALKVDKSSYASTEYTLTLLNFFAERYNASRSESAAETAYRSLATETFNSFLASIQSDQPCRNVSSENLINITLDFQKRNEAVKPDSRAGKLYEMMVLQIGKIIPSHYRRELTTKAYDFRQADTEGNKYYKLFTSSKPESFLKGTHLEMSLAAYAAAEQSLIKEVQKMDNEKRYELIVEFQAKYNNPSQYHQETMMKYLLILSEQGTLFKIFK
ncbi:beta-sandwich domain-containing protein [Bdellovibrio sp. HCB2-146]|uniref:beta-sandwich domain-containing protein n=1 Tax=Bdellovibrio sp. HCB2-146 TaxID=3394362 RepID=UPI0039BD7BD7